MAEASQIAGSLTTITTVGVAVLGSLGYEHEFPPWAAGSISNFLEDEACVAEGLEHLRVTSEAKRRRWPGARAGLATDLLREPRESGEQITSPSSMASARKQHASDGRAMSPTHPHLRPTGCRQADCRQVSRGAVRHEAARHHLTLDVALRLFSFGTKECWELVERMRLDLLGAAGRAGLNVVSTLVFSHPDDRGHIGRLVEASDKAGAVMSFVQLRPRRPVLEERVRQPSRQGTRKVRDVAVLGRMLEKYDHVTPIHEDDFSIDNSELAAEEVAAMIASMVGIELAG